MRGITGGLAAGLLFVLPGFVSIFVLSVVYAQFQETPLVQAIFFGLQAAILAIVAQAVVRIGSKVLKNPAMLTIAAMAFVAVFFLRLPFPIIVVAAGIVGLIGARVRPDLFHVIKGHNLSTSGIGGQCLALQAPHTLPNLKRAGLILVTCLILWLVPLMALQSTLGTKHVFTQQGWFFSKVSMVTFGGAYAVLPYVASESEDRGWTDSREMMAGLGMAETTPGPLIQVVQFVGFLGAYKQPGGLHPLLAGLIGSLIVNWVTYLPCFLWIFLGAPYIERLRDSKLLSSALSAITAAVVGVVLNLAIWFTLKALFGQIVTVQQGPVYLYAPTWLLDPESPRHFSWSTALLALAAAIALFRYRRGIIEVLSYSVIAGIALYMMGAR